MDSSNTSALTWLEQLAASVQAAGVPLVRCEGEADPDVASAAARATARGLAAYVLGANSELCVY